MRLRIREPEWPPRTVEEVAASLLPELESFLSDLRTDDGANARMLSLLPDFTVARKTDPPGKAQTYLVTAPRDPSGAGAFLVRIESWPNLEDAAEDARTALRSYPAYVRSLMSELLRAGVDLQDLADQALAGSVMDE